MKTEKIMAVLLGISLFAASSGITSAYLHSYPDTLYNVVSADVVNVRLTEPDWDPERASGLTPGSVVPKNPCAVNIGNHDAWIFLRLSIPIRHIALVNVDSRRREEAGDTPLFSFAASDGWQLIQQSVSNGAQHYVYGYKTLVKPQEQTQALFEKVTLVPYLEGELSDKEKLQIPLEAAAVQDKTCPAGASLSDIYQIYLQEESSM